MRIHLSEHFTYSKLLRFVLPSIAMVIFTSVYNIVDGLFVSRFVGKVEFAALNLVFPVLMILGSLGTMIGSGGEAIVAKKLGQGRKEKANKYFSMLIFSELVLGTIFAIIGYFVLPMLLEKFGATGKFLDDAIIYGRVILIALPFFIMEFSFQSFFVTAEKPQLGLAVTVFGGVLNILLDALFIGVFGWGLIGAALATVASQFSCAVLEIIYFFRQNDSLLQLTTETKFYRSVFVKACANGSSEMVEMGASSAVSVLYNYQLIKYLGENGVAAYGVMEYISFIFAAIFLGYTLGISPAISFQFGAKGFDELKNLLKKSLVFVGIFGLIMFACAEIFAATFANIFVGYDAELYELTIHAFKIYAISFLFIGFNIFGSAFFTALNNGVLSAVISFVRTFVFEIGCVILLPIIFGVEGIWYSVIFAEGGAFILTGIILFANRKNISMLNCGFQFPIQSKNFSLRRCSLK